MVVASAEGLDHDVTQGGLGQVAILLLGARPWGGPPAPPPPGPAWVAILPGAAQAPRGAVRPRASAAPRVAILLAEGAVPDRPRGPAPRGQGPPSWWGWPEHLAPYAMLVAMLLDLAGGGGPGQTSESGSAAHVGPTVQVGASREPSQEGPCTREEAGRGPWASWLRAIRPAPAADHRRKSRQMGRPGGDGPDLP